MREKHPFDETAWRSINLFPNEKSIQKRETASNESHPKDNNTISTPAIVGIVVFLVVAVSALFMFFFYRRRRKTERSKTCRSPQVVRHDPITVQTSTVQLTSQGSPMAIPAAPDYNTFGIGRRLSRPETLNESSSSEEEQDSDNNGGLLHRYDWSSSQRRKSKGQTAPEEETEPTADDNESEDEEITYPPGHTGRIWFHVDYQSPTEKLEVTVIKVRNLPLRKNSSNPPDPVVWLYLLPDDRCQRRTEPKRKTQNPNFRESFIFQVARDHLSQRVLRLSVYDLGKGRGGDVIGHVLYSLKDQVFGVEAWRDLETISEVESKLGELHVSLGYYPVLSRLTVIVLRAANLPLRNGRSNPDTYVKVTFSKGNNVLKVKKTDVKLNTSEPFFNESFNITTTMDDLPSCSLLLSVYQSTASDDEGEDGKLIGRVLLGGMMYARGKELGHWTEVISQPRTIVKYWHSLAG